MLKVIIICLATFATLKAVVREKEHPNIIMLHAGKLDWNDIGIHVKNSKTPTPNIDYLAFSGIIFNRFYTNGGLKSIFSGCYKRSQCAKINLMSIFFERNGYSVNINARHDHDRTETFEKSLLEVIKNQKKPFLTVVDFGSVGNDVHISQIDEIVASIVTTAHHLGVINNTIILFLSLPDNDEASLEINIRRTAFVYSPLLNLQPRVSNQMIHLIDLLPTLVNASNLKWPTKEVNIDGFNQWSALNNNDDKRTEIYGDNFYIHKNWKLSYGVDKKTNSYRRLADENLESDQDPSEFDLEAYVRSVMRSEVHHFLNKLNPQIISSSKNRAEVHCHLQGVEINLGNISCSHANPCLFDLLADPCELNNKLEQEFYLRRQKMTQMLDEYLRGDEIENILSKSFAVEDPNSSMEDGPVVGIILGVLILSCILAFIIVVCVKEKCNRKRSVYYDKSRGKATKTGSIIKNEPSLNSSSGEHSISVISHNLE